MGGKPAEKLHRLLLKMLVGCTSVSEMPLKRKVATNANVAISYATYSTNENKLGLLDLGIS